MRVNRLTEADKSLPRNIRRVLAGLRKPVRAEERAILKARVDAEERARLAAAKIAREERAAQSAQEAVT